MSYDESQRSLLNLAADALEASENQRMKSLHKAVKDEPICLSEQSGVRS